MCGIFGAVGEANSTAITLKKLKELEYRGYDSWGIASLAQLNNKQTQPYFEIQKQTGKIQLDQIKLKNTQAKLAFGHTRWATHGGVTQANAHPHFNQDKTLVAVHNGIIENYQQLKQQLPKDYPFNSETDSEVFVALVEQLMKKHDFKESVRLAFKQIKGYSAFIIAHAPGNQLVAIKNGSPLIIGLAQDKTYFASDVNVLLDYTKQIVFLPDNHLAHITPTQTSFYQVKTGQVIKPEVKQIDWQPETIESHKFPFYLEKEIHDQVKVLSRIQLEFDQPVQKLAKLIGQYSKIYLVGCGTAYHAALTSQYLLVQTAGIQATAVAGSEFSYQLQFCKPENTLVIFFSQSGETIDVVKPLKALKKKGVKTVGLVNAFGSTLYRLADFKIWLKAGPEKSVLSTKAFTAKISIMSLVAAYLVDLDNFADSSQPSTYHQAKLKLSQATQDLKTILSDKFQSEHLDPLAQKLIKHAHLFSIGRGLSYPIALEGALKIKEVTYQHMEGFAGGELKHGVIALIEKGTPCFAIAPADQEKDLILSGAMEIRSRGGCIIGLAPKNNQVFDHFIPVENSGVFSAITNSAIMQLIAYKMARLLDLDPDKPRNLAKSVTVV